MGNSFCDKCNVTFKSQHGLAIHYGSIHPGWNYTKIPDPPRKLLYAEVAFRGDFRITITRSVAANFDLKPGDKVFTKFIDDSIIVTKVKQ